MKSFRKKNDALPQRLQVIPLIDVVFMLLAFLLITFKMNAPEGDFEILMPPTGDGATSLSPAALPEIAPVQIRILLSADTNGNLTNVQIGSVDLGPDPERLRDYLVELVGTAPSEIERQKWEAEIIFDEHLRYQHVIDAMTSVRGYLQDGHLVPLIDKINIADRSG